MAMWLPINIDNFPWLLYSAPQSQVEAAGCNKTVNWICYKPITLVEIETSWDN